MKKGKIFILSGPSGSGKTTLYKKLISSQKLQGKLAKVISVTTRPKREGEEHGRDYFFVSPTMFNHKRQAGHFVESQKVFDNYYGTPKKQVKTLLRAGKSVLLCIDVKGAKVVNRQLSGVIKIFVSAPSLSVLKKRIEQRGAEDKKTIDLRIKTAKKELLEARHYDHIIINDRLNKAFSRLEKLVLSYLN